MTKILYKQDNGVVAIISPVLDQINPNTGQFWTVDEIAAKDVPTGLKYKIIDVADLPASRNFRDAWTVSESDLTDGEGA